MPEAVEGLEEFFPKVTWQRCVVNCYRNVMVSVPPDKVKAVMVVTKATHAQEDQPAAREKAEAVVRKLEGMRLGKAARLVYPSFLRRVATRRNYFRRPIRRST